MGDDETPGLDRAGRVDGQFLVERQDKTVHHVQPVVAGRIEGVVEDIRIWQGQGLEDELVLDGLGELQDAVVERTGDAHRMAQHGAIAILVQRHHPV